MVKQAVLVPAAAAALGLLLLWRLADGTAAFLVQGWYLPILFVSSLILVVLAALALVAERNPAEGRGRVTGAGLLATGLIAVPVLLGFAFEPRQLGTGSLGDEALSSRRFSASAASGDAALRNIYQWAYEFQTKPPAEIAGAPVELIGFVFHNDEDTGDRFHVARFVVACCVADAQGIALPVQWRDAATLRDDQWVRIDGRVATGPDGAALIQAHEITEMEAPSNPYIYP